MLGRFKVVTVVGSTRFKGQYEEICTDLELNGYIVLRMSTFSHHDNIELSEHQIQDRVDIFKEYFKLSDEVYVVSVDGYVGDHTRADIEAAKEINPDIKIIYCNRF